MTAARMLNSASMPLPMPDDAADLLKEWGIRRVVCGHTAHGNAPTVFTTKGIEVTYAPNALFSWLC
jgi:hypothetical protein